MHDIWCVLLAFLLLIFFSTYSIAGIENELLKENADDCIIRITHDATPDSKTGTIIFRSYTESDEIHYPCDVSKKTFSKSLGKAFKNYLTKPELKPVTSIMLGRLIRYPWARLFLQNNAIAKVNNNKFNKIMHRSPITGPVEKVMTDINYDVTGVSCEKILYKDNHAIDAMCWIMINSK